MNLAQRIILIVTAVVVGAMTLFPPYESVLANTRLDAGYAFIFALPTTVRGYEGPIPASINAVTLFMQILGVVVVGALLFVSAKSKPNA